MSEELEQSSVSKRCIFMGGPMEHAGTGEVLPSFIDVEVTDLYPVPERQTIRWRELAERMKSGDSVKLRREHVNGLSAALNSRGFRVVTEELADGKVRVWKGPSFELSLPVRFRIRMAMEKAGCDVQSVRGDVCSVIKRLDALEAELKKERDILEAQMSNETP